MHMVTLWMLWCLVGLTLATTGYTRDLSMNAEFPGPVYKQSANLPDGHLKPLGWQRRPDSPIPEEPEMPGSREFFDKFVQHETPVVFRAAIPDAPALNTWDNDRYLADKYGHLNVTTRLKLARSQNKVISEEQVIKLKKFLSTYTYDNVYLASWLPREMMHELPLPKCVRCGTINENLISAQLWMSSGGTSSRLHSHDDHLLHCVLFGRRDFILIEDAHKRHFAYHDEYPGSLGGYSDLDTERINVLDFKSVLRIPWIWATLSPGECLFVPTGYLHQVRSYGRSISLTIEFSRISEFDDSGCHLIEKEFVPLSEAYFLLAFEDGRLRLHDLELDAEKVRHLLISLVGKDDFLRLAKFEHFYQLAVGEDPRIPSARAVFDLLSPGRYESKLTKDEILILPDVILKSVANIINDVYADIRKAAAQKKKSAKAETKSDGKDKPKKRQEF